MEKKVTYKTKDGSKFSDEEAAARHEKLAELQDAYDSATKAYGRALAETFTTADGFPFSWAATWYYLPYCHGDHHGLRHLTLYPWSMIYELAGYRETGELTMIEMDDKGQVTKHRISDLYRKEENANKRLLEMMKEERGWLDDSIAELEEKLGK